MAEPDASGPALRHEGRAAFDCDTAEPAKAFKHVEPDPGIRGLAAYGVFGLPLAFAALPIYVHVPKLYVEAVGLPLAVVGAVLLGVRFVDALTDPLIGWFSDRFAARRVMIALSLPLLAGGMVGLFSPPADAGAAWLASMILIVTLGFSVATINYGAWGAEVASTPVGRTRVVAAREAFALIGVVLAAALPSVIAPDMVSGLARLALLFLPLLILAGAITLFLAPTGAVPQASHVALGASLIGALAHRPFRLLVYVFAANGIAAAVPASTVLFFVADVLGAESLSGLFLALYFVAGAASLPVWVRLSSRIGKVRAWLASMLLAIAVFVWAYSLGAGDVMAFAVICILSGAALGADLALPPAMLADLLARDSAGQARAGAWFGWWNFVTKANLAIAAGVALPLLGWLGYAAGASEPSDLKALAAVYALLPVVLKLFSAGLLWSLRKELDFEGHRT